MLEALGYVYELKAQQYQSANKEPVACARLRGSHPPPQRTLTFATVCHASPIIALTRTRPHALQLLGIPGLYHSVRERVHTLREGFGVVAVAVDLHLTLQKRQHHEEQGTLTEEMRNRMDQEAAVKSAEARSAPPKALAGEAPNSRVPASHGGDAVLDRRCQ